MINKLKNWLIGRLGGVPLSAIPLDIQQTLLNHWTNNTLDKRAAEVFARGFLTTSYTDEKSFQGESLMASDHNCTCRYCKIHKED